MKRFGGTVLFLDRSDINTDEIIPAKYLTEITKEALKPYVLEDLELAGFDPKRDIPGKSAIVTRDNFGCGSSREHAPWALEVNGIHVVVARGFARIFRQNMYNCGMLAIELPDDEIDELFSSFAGKDTIIEVDLLNDRLHFTSSMGKPEEAEKITDFSISDFDRALVTSGGWVEYADTHY
jgi:3-isopropylmalate/(R)-2-methylmalate dehydratase small subunit